MPPNHLAPEKSPYLLQHAHNPVDWYPWGEEAFEHAKREDKPIFLSIGYSTCHWCHVMAHESFEDPDVAKLLNSSFVCIKVDREERPDIDNVYMSVCQMMNGNCGWPLTILMTPDKKPFLAATYIPKRARFGQQGMLELIGEITRMWMERREELTRLAEGITATIGRRPESPGQAELDGRTLQAATDILAHSFDDANGGFGTAPKFPSPHNLLFLLRGWKRTGDARSLEMVERTLGAMRNGGLWDHVGFGFHRYSTDAGWFVPHFEKMLYDQAMLAMAYLEAHQATRKEEYATTARQTLDYVLRDMMSGEGGFFSAEDADSEGEEGRFYLWTEPELRDVLGREDASFTIRVFGVTRHGNFQNGATTRIAGQNILHLNGTMGDVAAVLGTDEPALKERLEAIQRKLFEARSKRVRPHKDDKVLADWNGLMVAALAMAARVLGDENYAGAARKASRFVLDWMYRDGRLLHRYRDGEASITANLEDHAFVVWGLLELYELDFEPADLKTALELNETMLAHFWDNERGGLFFSPDDGEKLLARQKEVHDGALPSGNSVAACNMVRLSRLTGDAALEERAMQLMKAFSNEIAGFPAAHTHLLMALEMAMGPSCEVVIAGEIGGPDTRAFLEAIHRDYHPNLVVMVRPEGEKGEELAHIAPFVRELRPVDGKASAYVCSGCSCKKPTPDVNEMMGLLGIVP
jgi:uncharacterized protein YyaL (SSP411 family)